MTKRIKLSWIFSFVVMLLLSLGLGFGFIFENKSVAADEAVAPPIEMVDGASIRLFAEDGKDGIRFIVKMSKEEYEDRTKDGQTFKTYILVIPTDVLNGKDLTVNTPTVMKEDISTKWHWSTDYNAYINAVYMYKLGVRNYNRPLSFRACIQVAENDYIYTNYNEAVNSRSMTYVAEEALKDIQNNGDYTSDLYSFERISCIATYINVHTEDFSTVYYDWSSDNNQSDENIKTGMVGNVAWYTVGNATSKVENGYLTFTKDTESVEETATVYFKLPNVVVKQLNEFSMTVTGAQEGDTIAVYTRDFKTAIVAPTSLQNFATKGKLTYEPPQKTSCTETCAMSGSMKTGDCSFDCRYDEVYVAVTSANLNALKIDNLSYDRDLSNIQLTAPEKLQNLVLMRQETYRISEQLEFYINGEEQAGEEAFSKLKYSSSDEDVVAITPNSSIMTGVSLGDAVITCSYTEDFVTITETFNVKVVAEYARLYRNDIGESLGFNNGGYYHDSIQPVTVEGDSKTNKNSLYFANLKQLQDWNFEYVVLQVNSAKDVNMMGLYYNGTEITDEMSIYRWVWLINHTFGNSAWYLLDEKYGLDDTIEANRDHYIVIKISDLTIDAANAPQNLRVGLSTEDNGTEIVYKSTQAYTSDDLKKEFTVFANGLFNIKSDSVEKGYEGYIDGNNTLYKSVDFVGTHNVTSDAWADRIIPVADSVIKDANTDVVGKIETYYAGWTHYSIDITFAENASVSDYNVHVYNGDGSIWIRKGANGVGGFGASSTRSNILIYANGKNVTYSTSEWAAGTTYTIVIPIAAPKDGLTRPQYGIAVTLEDPEKLGGEYTISECKFYKKTMKS